MDGCLFIGSPFTSYTSDFPLGYGFSRFRLLFPTLMDGEFTIMWKILVGHILPWFLIPLILMLIFTDDIFQTMIIIGAFTVLFIDYIALGRKKRIPLALLGVTMAAIIGYFFI